MQLANGHKLQNGKYRIEQKIGQGGFGITYLARWYKETRGAMGTAKSYYMIVIKEFFWSRYCNRDADGHTVSISSAEGKALMAQFKEKLKKEGKIISRLSHPNIVGILDIFEENNTAYLVMQYVEGESLDAIIREKGKIDEATALQYMEQICSALSEIHSKRILHLDVKPSNILIDEDSQVQLIDFGVSKQYDESAQETSVTPIGVSKGYSPVEQYGTLTSFSPPPDIYAAGATLYKMLTGVTPIEATARSQSDLDPVTYYCPDISKQTAAAITKAMNEKMRDRFQTAEAFRQALIDSDMSGNRSTDNKTKDDKTKIDTPSKDPQKIILDNTKIERQPRKKEEPKPPAPSQKPPVKDPVTKPPVTVIWQKVWFGAVGAAAVLALVFFLFYFQKPKPVTATQDTTTQNVLENPVATNTPPQTTPTSTPTTSTVVTQPDPEKEERERQTREAERRRQEQEAAARRATEAADLVRQATATFNNNSLGMARYEQSFQLYKKAKDMGGNVSTGYSNFLSLAESLIANGAGFDANVKTMLQYAQQLNNTQKVRELLEKCN